MKISKLLPVLCAFAVGVHGLTVRAEDNPAQAAARAALAKQSSDNSVLPATVAPETHAAMTPNSQQQAKAKAKADKLAAEAKAKQEAADLKAKKAADKKLAGQQALEAKAKADQSAAAVKQSDADQRAAQSAALAAALAQQPAPQPPANAGQPPVAKAKPGKKLNPVTPVQPAAAAVPPPGKLVEANYIGKDLGMKAIAAPALPIAASKEERLQALLEKYKADLISPEEYHQQRAAILAQP